MENLGKVLSKFSSVVAAIEVWVGWNAVFCLEDYLDWSRKYSEMTWPYFLRQKIFWDDLKEFWTVELDGVWAEGTNLRDTWVARATSVKGRVCLAQRVSRWASSKIKSLITISSVGNRLQWIKELRIGSNSSLSIISRCQTRWRSWRSA